MKNTIVAIGLLLTNLCSIQLSAQILSTKGNGSSKTENVKASEITTGGLSGDVNVFTGTYNSSYSLGKVTNPNGLTFDLGINYGSVYSGGDNMPHVAGVPYGEGWNVSIPTISVSTEDFNKFTSSQNYQMMTQNIAVNGNYTPKFTFEELSEEGRVYFFSPNVSIPGVASGRMVYKYKRDGKYYYSLAEFDRYLEIVYDPTTVSWVVYLDNGDVYNFGSAAGVRRNPTNQRAFFGATEDIATENHMPKVDATIWYCNLITNANNLDRIDFKYEDFGRFDYWKMQHSYLNGPPQNFEAVVAKDVILKEVSSLHEKIVLEYRSIPTTGGQNMVGINDANVTRLDSMYTQKSVVKWQGNDFQQNWYRYLHGKSYNLNGANSCNGSTYIPISSTNPYKLKLSTSSYFGFSRELVGNENNGAALFTVRNPNNSSQYRSGYLENKDRIPFSSMPAGEIYTLKAYVQTPIGSSRTTLLDINLATGHGTSAGIGNNDEYECYNKTYGENVFSTFSSALKWTIRDKGTGRDTIVNYFNMPNLPTSYNGINIQIGPANADIDYSVPESGIGLLVNDLVNVNTTKAYYYKQYQQNPNYDGTHPTALPKSGNPMHNNFGIGVPWGQVRTFTIAKYPWLAFNNTNSSDPFWFNTCSTTSGGIYQWPSRPTAVSTDVALEYTELFRIAKNPYMLSKAKHYVKNNLGVYVLDNVLALNYEIKTVNYSVASKSIPNSINNSDFQTEYKGTRNVVLLKAIRSLPVSESSDFQSNSTAATTQFSYRLMVYTSILGAPVAGRQLNSDGYVLEKIVNALGREDSLEYYPQSTSLLGLASAPNTSANYSIILNNTGQLTNWADLSDPNSGYSTCNYGGRRYTGPSYSMTLNYLVKKKYVKDRGGIYRASTYTYENGRTVEQHVPMSEQFLRNYEKQYRFGWGKTTVVGPDGEKTEYKHHTSDRLFGKIDEILVTDQNNIKVSRNQTLYKIQLAFEGANYRLKPNAVIPYHYYEYILPLRPMRTTATSGNSLTNYYTSLQTWLNSNNPNPVGFHPDGVTFSYETRYNGLLQSTVGFEEHLNSFFIAVDTTKSVQYETCGDSIMSITKYTYFDSNHDGHPSVDEPYNSWLGSSFNSSVGLKWEPSWQLASTYTYSPQMPDAYTKKENFYLFDLINSDTYMAAGFLLDLNYTTLYWTQFYNLRNLVAETRTTTKAWGENPLSKSTYYMYSTVDKPTATRDQPLKIIYLDSVCVQVTPAVGAQTALYFSTTTYKPIIPYDFVTIKRLWDYDAVQYIPKKTSDIRNLVTAITYNSNATISKTEQGFGLTNLLTTNFTYRTSDNRIDYVTDPNGTIIKYEYDSFGRLWKMKRNGIDIQQMEYGNFNNNTAHSFKEKAAQNFVKATNYIDASANFYSMDFVDPLGRKVTNCRNSTLQSDAVYDFAGRMTLSRTPYVGTVPSIDPPANTTTEANFQYDAVPRNRVVKSSKFGLDIAGSKVTTYSYCTANGSNSTVFNSTTSGQPLLSQYISGGARYRYSDVTDEDLKSSRTITNAAGQKVLEQSNNLIGGVNFTTLYQYDSYGNVKKVSNPRALVSNYTYNYLNQLYQKVTPDAGTELYGYNPDGTLAAMQDANGVIRVYTYDQFGRMLSQKKVTNAATATFLFTNNGNPWITGLTTYQTNFASLLSSNSTFEKKWYYDTYDATLNNNYLANAKPYLLYSISNAKGRLVQTIAYNNTGVGVEYRWFSYNTDGFLKWEMSQFHFQALAAASGLRGRLFRIDYPSYNRQGSPLLANVDFNGDHSLDGQYAYNYDGLNRLKSVWFNYDNSQNNTGGGVNGGSKILEYDYDDLKNKVTKKRYYANFKYVSGCTDNTNKLIDEYTYAYDQRFRLTDLSSTTNYFRWQMYYDGNNASTANAYGATPSTSTNWNGNINSTMATYNVAGIGGTGMSGPTTYHYTYDAINRLTKGDAGVNIQTYSPGFANQPDLGDETMAYDRIGNISTLTRGELISGTLAQNLYAYTYLSTNNRLQSVTKNGAADRSVGYDSNGNMLTDSKIGITASTLGRANLPYAVTKSGTSINYLYSGDDNRIYKAVSTTQKEWYIRTGGGADLGVFDISNNKYTWYVFGAERVAKINHVPTLTITEAAGNTGGNLYTSDPFVIPLNVGSNLPAPIADYYAYDHLGNTRLVYGALIGCASSVPNYQLRYAGDYYPFGKVLREWSATTSEKYLYTQKERDKETGLDYFGARYYDSELGRFLGVDPMAEKFQDMSSYAFCNNNALRFTDPTGMAPTDIVFFNRQGQETNRIKSNTIFRTFVEDGNISFMRPQFAYAEAQMPNIIQTRTQSGEVVSGAKYQANDYQIAASTFLTNQELNSGKMIVADKGGNIIPQSNLANVPDISVDKVKAWSMQESHAGTTGGILQVNNAGDYTKDKAALGITKGATFTIHQEINLAIRYAIGKGFSVTGVSYSNDGNTVNRTYSWKGWTDALKGYGPGAKNPNYQNYINTMQNQSVEPKPSNY